VRAQQEREELRRRLHAMAEGRDGDTSDLAELRHRLEAAVAQRDELGIRCAEAQRKAEVLARQVERIQADRDELAGHAGDLQRRLDELDDVERERDALKRHYDAAAPEHNLLALLDLYMIDLRRAEDELARLRRIEAAAAPQPEACWKIVERIRENGERHGDVRDQSAASSPPIPHSADLIRGGDRKSV